MSMATVSLARGRLLTGILLFIVGSSLYVSLLCQQERAEIRVTRISGDWYTEAGESSAEVNRYVPENAQVKVLVPLDVGTGEQEIFPEEASDSSQERDSELEADAENDPDDSEESIQFDSKNSSESIIESRTESEMASPRIDIDAPSAEAILRTDSPPSTILSTDSPPSTILSTDSPPSTILSTNSPPSTILSTDSPPSTIAYNTHCAIPVNDSKLPICPFCYLNSFHTVKIYLEEIKFLDMMYWDQYTKREKEYPEACEMPDGVKCILQHTNRMADVVFRMQWFIKDDLPVRYCYPQIISILNSEAEPPNYRNLPHVKHAEIRIDFHLNSEVPIAEGCRMETYREAMRSWSPPDPSEHHGVAMFLSHCKDIKWRYHYVARLLQLMGIDMHGTCFHNVANQSDRFQSNYETSFISKVKPYRVVLVFENHRQEAYISEKIFAAFSANGVVPVYHGAPDVHMWLPGNHTYVDATQYDTPEALADYIKLILNNDTVYEYHTTNYDTQKVLDFLDQRCPPKDDYICHLCRLAYKLKKDSFHNGRRHCNCSGPASTGN